MEEYESDTELTWEDFFGSAEDLVPTLLSMYDALVGRKGGPPRPPEPPPPVPRPLSQASIASSSSSSSSGGGTMCKRKAFLASIESLEDSEDEVGSRSSPSKAGSQGSEDSGVCSPRSYLSSRRDLSYTDRVVLEIVQTEQVYVDHLSQVIHGYMEELERSSDSPLSETQFHQLFGNIRQIYTFNSTFLRELEECGLDPVKVAQVFVKNNSGFSVYTHYCTNYPRAVGVLTGLMRDEAVVKLFRERQASLGHTLPLGSYLLKPVQRILKYHLLLQNIVKNCGEKEGYSDVVTALSTMTGIAHHINDMKRKHEHAVRVQEIQSLLLGWQGEDLTRYGELCAEGTFRMSGAKAQRHAFLFDQILLITKKKEEGILQYKAHIMCSNLMLIESIPGEPLCFHVIPFDNPRHQYTLQARSLEQKREWTLQLKRVILENYNAVIPSHARQLVMELGQNRTEDEVVSERSAPKRQHSAPEYLERRKQERRKSEAGFIRARLRPRHRKSDHSPNKDKQRLRRSTNGRGDDSLQTSTESKLDMCGSQEGCCPSGSLTEQSSQAGSQDLHISEEEEPKEEKKKTLEEIVSQLLMQNKEFQRVLKKQRHLTGRSRGRAETSDEEEGDYDNLWSGKGGEMGPTSPAVWLKEQHQHLVTSSKAGSLPRGFGAPDWGRAARVSPDRPFTIASHELNLEDMERYAEQRPLARHRFPLPDETEDESTPDTSTQDLVHPEHRIYRASLKQVVSAVSGKLAGLRLSSEALDRAERRASRAFAKLRRGNSAVGARMAHGSDYADPRALFPALTRSEKAASLLGIRPASDLSSSSGYASSSKSSKVGAKTEESIESDGSADSFYERSFEAIESSMLGDVCRDSAVFSDPEEFTEQYVPKSSSTKKIPPPVPDKPPNLKASRRYGESRISPVTSPCRESDKTEDEYDSSSVASTVIENTTSNKGWVKHVICKIQGDQSF